jgi:hypothetical protein
VTIGEFTDIIFFRFAATFSGNVGMTGITYGSSSEELADPKISPKHVEERLRDWRDRVEALYADIERELEAARKRGDTQLSTRYEVKRAAPEELPRRVGIVNAEQPPTLHIVRPNETDVAVLSPRGLWIIGANGRVDLTIPRTVSSEVYMLIDLSAPLSGAANWTRVPIGMPFNREPFTSHWLVRKLQ